MAGMKSSKKPGFSVAHINVKKRSPNGGLFFSTSLAFGKVGVSLCALGDLQKGAFQIS
jgi:hypothetical protein